MGVGSESSRPVSEAAEALRRVRDETLPGEAEALDQGTRQAVDAVAGELENAGVDGELGQMLRHLAHEIRVAGTRMTAAREDGLGSLAGVFTGEADHLDALVRHDHHTGGDVVPGLAPPVLPTAADLESRVSSPDLNTGAADAKAWLTRRVAQHPEKRQAINEVAATVSPTVRVLARNRLHGKFSHAVSRHGHHLTEMDILARVQWLLDPAGEDEWTLHNDGSVTSLRPNGRPHQMGTSTGSYASARAVAKPLEALLTAAGPTPAELDDYLGAKANGDTYVAVFLHPDDTGITPDDVYTLRAPGTDTKSGKKMWLNTRKRAMKGNGAAPAVREYDMVTHGKRPGSFISFAKASDGHWRLVTSYFTDDPKNLSYTEL